ncbi:MAG: macrolide ABC transporter ATP-binding protein, partial [Oscillospiraceae bacterium]|nr:macrolide ABC transporter ATP-binding protein [Oscillospiraceae bacterium]
ALAMKPMIILADEPTGSLDSNSGKEVMNFMRELSDEGKTVIIITHDNAIAESTKRIIRISDGRIAQ